MRLRQQAIPKEGGKGTRILSIPTIRDRVVQGALQLILEPIFEADFQPGSRTAIAQNALPMTPSCVWQRRL